MSTINALYTALTLCITPGAVHQMISCDISDNRQEIGKIQFYKTTVDCDTLLPGRTPRQTDEPSELTRHASLVTIGRRGGHPDNQGEKTMATKKTFPCWCGCNGMTKSRFIPGHDARFHSWAKAVARGEKTAGEVALDLPHDLARSEFLSCVEHERPIQAERMRIAAEKEAEKAKKAEEKAAAKAKKAEEIAAMAEKATASV